MHAIYGAGGLGKTIADSLRRATISEEVSFLDDNPSLHGESIASLPVLGGLEALSETDDFTVIVGYGADAETRLELAEDVAATGAEFFSVVDSEATVSDVTTVGPGVYVNAGCYIGPDVTLMEHVVLDSAVNVSHDVSIGPGTIVTPGATIAGNVDIQRGCYIGPGATVLKRRIVGEHAVVGAGAVVTDDVAPGETVVGVPAKPIDGSA